MKYPYVTHNAPKVVPTTIKILTLVILSLVTQYQDNIFEVPVRFSSDCRSVWNPDSDVMLMTYLN